MRYGIAALFFFGFFFPVHSFGKENSTKAEFVIRNSNGWLDIYFANRGVDDLSERYRIDLSDVGVRLKFFFFTKDGKCNSCILNPEKDFVYRIPVAYKEGPIFSAEMAGITIPTAEISERYGIKQGCYGFYAAFSIKEKGGVRNYVSNAQSLCVGEHQR
ncbi:MAG: hypothetical protein ACTHOH_10365 [Lysobacteraceae bacterium]